MTSSSERRDLEREDHRDTDLWLEALLEEVLGGQGPPDLKQQILARWNAQSPVHAPVAVDDPVPPPLVVTPATRLSQRQGYRPRRSSPVWSVMAGACLLALLTTGFLYWQTRPNPHHSPVVLGATRPSETWLDRSAESRRRISRPGQTARDAHPRDIATPDVPETTETERLDDEAELPSTGESPWLAPNASDTDIVGGIRLADTQIIELINEHLRQRWEQMEVVPAPAVADASWCDRVYRHLIGRAPRSHESRAFLAEPAANRRVWLVNRLLSAEHAQELANQWSQNCADWWLRGSDGETRAFRNGLQAYLASEFAAGRPINDVFAGLIAATGSNDPARGDFHGATNYLLALSDRATPADLTSQICRAALGQRVGCAQCHDNQQGQLSQMDFWQITATLSTVQVDMLRPGRGRLRDVGGESDVTVAFESADGESLRATPAGLDGQPLLASDDRSRRAQLAAQLVSSADFARATVNRFWESLLHFGFTLPADDMGVHNPVSHPELVELLSRQFELHQYDLRQLLRWITLSDAFDRSDVIMASNAKDAPVEGGEPLFSRYYHRPRLYSQASQGLEQLAAGQSPQVTNSGSAEELQDLFSRRYGDPTRADGQPAEIGSDRMGQLLPSHYLARARALAVEGLTAEQQFEHAYLMVLGRRPTAEESARAAAIYRAAGDDAVVALERIVWILINTRS